LAGALSRCTKSAMVIVLGNSIALYNPSVRIAEEFSLLDVMTGGRFIAGSPLGLPSVWER
jgi:alkanesulfonate monooxygenase SsuD/methylene tetrahydromethanopterin reductase-like flavin-dependent oxidoreductase (luciferase family)